MRENVAWFGFGFLNLIPLSTWGLRYKILAHNNYTNERKDELAVSQKIGVTLRLKRFLIP
jgi:hypothetical protein